MGSTAIHLASVATHARDKEIDMLGEEHHDAIARRGLADVLACQDMLRRIPPKPTFAARVAAAIVAFTRSAVRLEWAIGRGAERPLPAIGTPEIQGDR